MIEFSATESSIKNGDIHQNTTYLKRIQYPQLIFLVVPTKFLKFQQHQVTKLIPKSQSTKNKQFIGSYASAEERDALKFIKPHTNQKNTYWYWWIHTPKHSPVTQEIILRTSSICGNSTFHPCKSSLNYSHKLQTLQSSKPGFYQGRK